MRKRFRGEISYAIKDTTTSLVFSSAVDGSSPNVFKLPTSEGDGGTEKRVRVRRRRVVVIYRCGWNKRYGAWCRGRGEMGRGRKGRNSSGKRQRKSHMHGAWCIDTTPFMNVFVYFVGGDVSSSSLNGSAWVDVCVCLGGSGRQLLCFSGAVHVEVGKEEVGGVIFGMGGGEGGLVGVDCMGNGVEGWEVVLG